MVREHAREDGARLEVELDDVIDQLKVCLITVLCLT